MAYFDKYGVEFSDDGKTLVRCPKDFQGEYVVPEGIARIGRNAFENCRGLLSIKFPNSLKEIWFYAFSGCTNLHLVIIPSSIEWIGKDAFDFSGEINAVVWNSKHCRDFEVSMFETITPFSNPEKIVSFVFGEQVEHIPDGICWRMSLLTSITIPISVRSIGNAAFLSCNNLKTIIIPENVAKIGERAFKYCHLLKSIKLPISIEEIGNHAFEECDALEEIIIPKGQKERFSQMDGLKNLTDKIVESLDDAFTYPKRSWENCERMWQEKYAEYAKQETEFAKIVFSLLEHNAEPLIMPPIGLCLTTEEYTRFKAEGRDLKKIHAWCWSGHDIHERMRLHLNSPINLQNEYCVGLKTPRKGIYKVIEKNNAMLRCYYLGKDVRNDKNEYDFLEEIVEINSSPLFNYNSVGPKAYTIEVGDIIKVDENKLMSSPRFNSKTYAIKWSFSNVKAKKVSIEEDDYFDYTKVSYNQYGGYNGLDDDTINSAFEGDPEATWNVD